MKIMWFLNFSDKNDAESSINFVKIPFLDPKRAKLNQNSDFGHVRTYSWLHKLRNTQGKIHGTYLGNIYGIYKECITNISRYLWYKIIRNTGAAFGGRPIGSVILFLYSLYIPYIFPSYVKYVFPCVFLNLWSQE